jgi:hypothetical protein
MDRSQMLSQQVERDVRHAGPESATDRSQAASGPAAATATRAESARATTAREAAAGARAVPLAKQRRSEVVP